MKAAKVERQPLAHIQAWKLKNKVFHSPKAFIEHIKLWHTFLPKKLPKKIVYVPPVHYMQHVVDWHKNVWRT